MATGDISVLFSFESICKCLSFIQGHSTAQTQSPVLKIWFWQVLFTEHVVRERHPGAVLHGGTSPSSLYPASVVAQ